MELESLVIIGNNLFLDEYLNYEFFSISTLVSKGGQELAGIQSIYYYYYGGITHYYEHSSVY